MSHTVFPSTHDVPINRYIKMTCPVMLLQPAVALLQPDLRPLLRPSVGEACIRIKGTWKEYSNQVRWINSLQNSRTEAGTRTVLSVLLLPPPPVSSWLLRRQWQRWWWLVVKLLLFWRLLVFSLRLSLRSWSQYLMFGTTEPMSWNLLLLDHASTLDRVPEYFCRARIMQGAGYKMIVHFPQHRLF